MPWYSLTDLPDLGRGGVAGAAGAEHCLFECAAFMNRRVGSLSGGRQESAFLKSELLEEAHLSDFCRLYNEGNACIHRSPPPPPAPSRQPTSRLQVREFHGQDDAAGDPRPAQLHLRPALQRFAIPYCHAFFLLFIIKLPSFFIYLGIAPTVQLSASH